MTGKKYDGHAEAKSLSLKSYVDENSLIQCTPKKKKSRKRRRKDSKKSKRESGVSVKCVKLSHSKRRASVVYSTGGYSNDGDLSTVIYSDDEEEERKVWKPCTPTPRGTEYSDVFDPEYCKELEKHNSIKRTIKCAGPPRPIIIDGVNVAVGYGQKKKFSSTGVALVWRFFAQRGHDIRILMPANYKDHCSDLSDLEATGCLRYFYATNRGKSPYFQYTRQLVIKATELGGVIVTRDTYDEMLQDINLPFAQRATINYRLLQYTFVEDVLLFPEDPLGRHGPKLEEFLAFPAYKNYSDLSKIR